MPVKNNIHGTVISGVGESPHEMVAQRGALAGLREPRPRDGQVQRQWQEPRVATLYMFTLYVLFIGLILLGSKVPDS